MQNNTTPLIQAAFFDIDGTLVSYDTHTMPQSTLSTLHTLRDQGLRLAVATGRPLKSIGFLRDLFEFDAYISMNGQRCFVGDALIRSQPFAREDIQKLVAIVSQKQYPCLLIESDRKYLNLVNDTVRAHFALVNEPLSPIVDISRALENDIFQFVIYTNDENEQELLDTLHGIEAFRAAPMCLDVIPKGGGKPQGIHAVLSHWDIPVSASIAFGDGMNDVSMMQYAGIGVAMGNADEPVKAAADYVTRHIDEGGIQHAFEHFGMLRLP